MAKALNDTLTPKQARFVAEYMKDTNGRQAAIRAGYPPRAATEQASRLLTNAKVVAILKEALERRAERVQVSTDDVLREWRDWVVADPRELIDIRRVPCRCCHGANGLPQETPPERHARRSAWELARALQEANAKTKDDMLRLDLTKFDELGGPEFYDERKPINPDCLSCFGRGEERVTAKDQSQLSPAAAKLLKGVKVTQNGIEILMHDKAKALEGFARHLGMDRQVNVNVNLDVEIPADPVEAARAYSKMLG